MNRYSAWTLWTTLVFAAPMTASADFPLPPRLVTQPSSQSAKQWKPLIRPVAGIEGELAPLPAAPYEPAPIEPTPFDAPSPEHIEHSHGAIDGHEGLPHLFDPTQSYPQQEFPHGEPCPPIAHGSDPYCPTTGYDPYQRPQDVGTRNYDLKSKFYGIWTRPAAFAEDQWNNCISNRPFAPRGYGVPHRATCQRVDYHPYVVKELPSTHGPSYMPGSLRVPCKACLQPH